MDPSVATPGVEPRPFALAAIIPHFFAYPLLSFVNKKQEIINKEPIIFRTSDFLSPLWRIRESNPWPPECKSGALANWANPPIMSKTEILIYWNTETLKYFWPQLIQFIQFTPSFL
jgi:hypothetical protein